MSQKMGLIGRKLGMTRYFHDDGSSLGCTVLEVGPCVVTGQRTAEKHGYTALQLGFEEQATRKITRPESGYFKKSGLEKMPAVVREVRLDEAGQMSGRQIGEVITAGVERGRQRGGREVRTCFGFAGDFAKLGLHWVLPVVDDGRELGPFRCGHTGRPVFLPCGV